MRPLLASGLLGLALLVPAAPATARPAEGTVVTPAGTPTSQPTATRRAVALPVSSPWALPPVVVLQARASGGAPAALRRAVLGAPALALSPAARRSVAAGRVAPGALQLLLRMPRVGSPLLVFAARGRSLRVQAPALWMTRRLVRGLTALEGGERPARLLLEPMSEDRAALAGPPEPRPGEIETLYSLYRAAGYRYGVDWRILAAINRIETDLGRNMNVSSAGAVGWMQFMPSTWRAYGVDASGDGVADPYDATDAVYSAARYLAAAGAERDIRRALFAYNHATWYVNDVLQLAASLPEAP